MFRGRGVIALVVLPLAVACATPTRNSRARSNNALNPRSNVAPPSWIDRPPELSGSHFFVGESAGMRRKDDALESAWVSALVRIGMTEFPELARVSAQSVEKLRGGSKWERRFAMQLEKVNWGGLREATEFGSPYLEWDNDAESYVVYRLLKWSEKEMHSAHKQLRAGETHGIPSSPESMVRREHKLVSAIKAMQAANERVEYRDHLFDKVFGEIRCGVTVDDLTQILGPADRYPSQTRAVEKTYFWGPYRVDRYGDDPAVSIVTKQGDKAHRRVVCAGRELGETS